MAESFPMVSPPAPRKKVNLRTPDVMARVQEQIENHYRSRLVEEIRGAGGVLRVGKTLIRLARQFGFCYGVERAIDLAYAARRVFPDKRIFVLGEIIHNPDVNAQLADMGIVPLGARGMEPDLTGIDEEDVIIVPAFGAETKTMERIREIGCHSVDTTCGDVMSVWRRVKQNASEGVTSIIHGKAQHEETRATASRALGPGNGQYLIVLNVRETDIVCDYIRNGGDAEAFRARFRNAMSEGFDPDLHLRRVGVANQTTMLRSETEEIQRRVRKAIEDRDSGQSDNFRFFDTICGATQERQDALFEMLKQPIDLMLVIGGYNSSNTTHLVEISEEKVPTYFVRNVQCLESANRIRHFDIHEKIEKETADWLPTGGERVVSITAGASCPNNLIEEVIERVLELRGEDSAAVG